MDAPNGLKLLAQLAADLGGPENALWPPRAMWTWRSQLTDASAIHVRNGKWAARVGLGTTTHTVGEYASQEEAEAAARDELERRRDWTALALLSEGYVSRHADVTWPEPRVVIDNDRWRRLTDDHRTHLQHIAERSAQLADADHALRDAVRTANAAGVSKAAIADAANVSKPTIYAWLAAD